VDLNSSCVRAISVGMSSTLLPDPNHEHVSISGLPSVYSPGMQYNLVVQSTVPTAQLVSVSAGQLSGAVSGAIAIRCVLALMRL
jgi:hypothetical protein